ncbi:MAG: hypothetical protein EXR27_00075 [Betaproteobacteria bacterium]|nr:hypothetical protein [Betaproteobacteria bacterium]
MSKRFEFLYSAGGLLAVLLILVLVNFVLGAGRVRVDLTEGRMYTLSEGTRTILSKLESPVRIRLYFSQGDGSVPLPIKAFGRRVEDLLAEFRNVSGGKVLVEKLDPQPDSDAEDSATLEGVEAQVMPSGDKFFLGLSVSYLDQKLAMPALSLDRERLFEYDLTRAIARATTTEKAVIGLMSPLPVFGMPANPRMGMPQQDPYTFLSELRRDFDVKRVGLDPEKIEDDVKVLIVIHPRGISDKGQFAIDQFVMRGGKLIAFLDTHAFFDQMPGPMAAMGGGGGGSSTLDKLLKAWGIEFDTGKVITDARYVSGGGQRAMPTLLSLSGPAFDPDDISTARIGTALIPFSGAFGGKPADGLKQTVLMKSSAYSMLTDANAAATNRGDAAMKDFKPSNIEYPIAIRLTGKFKTAFPGGLPAEKGDSKGDGKADGKPSPMQKGEADKQVPKSAGTALTETKGENAVVLVADSDFINDGAAVQVQELFGQRIVVPSNGNLAFAQTVVEQFAGDSNLVNLRSRATAARPFTVIREMEAKAQQAYLGKIKVLEDSLAQAQEKLGALQKSRGPGQSTAILSAEQQSELDKFRKTATETRRELKEVRKDLRADSEALQFWTKVFNIAAVPILVVVAGVVLALMRRRRTVSP